MTLTTDQDSHRAEHLRALEQEIGVLIRRVRRVIGERSRAVHPQLQPASYLMLGYLVSEGPMRASAMAEACDIDKGAISRQVGHLEDLGLVERSPDPEDGRASLVSASAEAVRRLEDVAADRRVWVSEQLSDWSEVQLAEFAGELRRYNEALNS
jgi:DNA-binding MarR family transcriptional regulator